MSVQATQNNHLNLTSCHAIELKQYLKEKYGIESVVGGDETLQITEAKASIETGKYDVYLEEDYEIANKVGIVKVIRELTGQGLAESIAILEGAPKLIKEGVDNNTAEVVKKKFEDAGARVSIKQKLPSIHVQDLLKDTVKRFLEDVVSLRTPPVIEIAGQRVHFVVRPIANDSTNELWTDAKNQRRFDLIDKEIDGAMTPEEVVELEELQTQMRRHVNKVAPLPMAGARKLQAELLAKAASASGQS